MMKPEEMAAYRAKLKREWTRRRVFTVVWFIVTIIVGVIYKLFFDVSIVLVIPLCTTVAQSQILEERKLSAQQFRILMADDAALRAKWYEEHDERVLTIRMRSGMPFVDYMNMVWNVAALIAAPFSIAVGVTLLIVSYVQTTVSVAVKGYWTWRLTGAEASEEDE